MNYTDDQSGTGIGNALSQSMINESILFDGGRDASCSLLNQSHLMGEADLDYSRRFTLNSNNKDAMISKLTGMYEENDDLEFKLISQKRMTSKLDVEIEKVASEIEEK